MPEIPCPLCHNEKKETSNGLKCFYCEDKYSSLDHYPPGVRKAFESGLFKKGSEQHIAIEKYYQKISLTKK